MIPNSVLVLLAGLGLMVAYQTPTLVESPNLIGHCFKVNEMNQLKEVPCADDFVVGDPPEPPIMTTRPWNAYQTPAPPPPPDKVTAEVQNPPKDCRYDDKLGYYVCDNGAKPMEWPWDELAKSHQNKTLTTPGPLTNGACKRNSPDLTIRTMSGKGPTYCLHIK